MPCSLGTSAQRLTGGKSWRPLPTLQGFESPDGSLSPAGGSVFSGDFSSGGLEGVVLARSEGTGNPEVELVLRCWVKAGPEFPEIFAVFEECSAT